MMEPAPAIPPAPTIPTPGAAPAIPSMFDFCPIEPEVADILPEPAAPSGAMPAEPDPILVPLGIIIPALLPAAMPSAAIPSCGALAEAGAPSMLTLASGTQTLMLACPAASVLDVHT